MRASSPTVAAVTSNGAGIATQRETAVPPARALGDGPCVQHADTLSGLREPEGGRAARNSCTDDDDVRIVDAADGRCGGFSASQYDVIGGSYGSARRPEREPVPIGLRPQP